MNRTLKFIFKWLIVVMMTPLAMIITIVVCSGVITIIGFVLLMMYLINITDKWIYERN